MAIVITPYGLLALLLAILLPPIGVFMEYGIGKDLAINILLTIFGYLPGIAHAVYLLAVSPEASGHNKVL